MHLLNELRNEPSLIIPEGETLRVVKSWGRNQDPFAFGRKPHKRIKGLKVGKRKRGKRNGRIKVGRDI